MRKIIALAAAAAVLVLAGCSSTPKSTDPYQVLDQATSASYGDLVQLNLGVDATGTSPDIHLDPSAIRVVVDTTSGKTDVAIALPLDALKVDAATRAALGVTGNTLDAEVLWDGAALYAKGQILQPMLTALVMQSGGTPGDYSGWVQLGTLEELGALVGSVAPQASLLPVGSAPAAASHDAASLKSDMEAAGVTFTYVGREDRGGQQTDHLRASVDVTKLESSSMANGLPTTQLSQVETALGQYDMSPDFWFDAGTHRLVEVDLHLTPKAGGTASPAASSNGSVTLVLKVSTPSDGSALQTPSGATQIDLAPMIQSLLKSFGGLIPSA